MAFKSMHREKWNRNRILTNFWTRTINSSHRLNGARAILHATTWGHPLTWHAATGFFDGSLKNDEGSMYFSEAHNGCKFV